MCGFVGFVDFKNDVSSKKNILLQMNTYIYFFRKEDLMKMAPILTKMLLLLTKD